MDSWLAQPAEAQLRRGRLAAIALGSLVLALGASQWSWTGGLGAGFAWGVIGIPLAFVWLLARTRFKERLSRQTWFWGAICLLMLDLGGVDLQAYAPRGSQEVLAEGAALASYLQGQAGTFRVYSPSYSLPQQAAASAGLELADGVDPLQLQSYVRFMEKASGVPSQGYSITLPAFASGMPAFANRDYLPDPALLARLNVRFVAAEYDLPAAGLEFRTRFGNTRLYENLQALPRAWVQPSNSPAGEDIRLVERLVWQPNQIIIRAQGPGVLVIAENSYPGWRAWVDGLPVALGEVEGLLRSAELPQGEHQVRLAFRPLSLYLGLGLCLLALAWLASCHTHGWGNLRSLFSRWPVRAG